MTTALLIADGGPEVGAGHWVRCLALAEALAARGVDCTLVTKEWDGEARPPTAWQAAPCRVAVLPTLDALPAADLVVLDSYRWTGELLTQFRTHAKRIAVITDATHGLFPGVDFIVNPHVAGVHARYAGAARTLLGPVYAPLRSKLRTAARLRAGPVKTLLLAAGAAYRGQSALVEQRGLIAAGLGDWEGEILLMGGHIAATAIAAGLGRPVKEAQDYGRAWQAFSRADLAITTASMTALECLCVGLPTLTFAAADHQRVAQRGLPVLSAKTLAQWMGSEDTRQKQSAWGMGLVDGYGAERIASLLTG